MNYKNGNFYDQFVLINADLGYAVCFIWKGHAGQVTCTKKQIKEFIRLEMDTKCR